MAEKPKKKKKDSVGQGLYAFYLIFVVLSLLIMIRLIWIAVFFKPADQIKAALTPSSQKESIEPARGAILSHDGKYLAMSFPSYDIYMDCTVMKSAFEQDEENGRQREAEWMAKAKQLSVGLAEVLGEKTANEYYELIKYSRNHGRKYVPICKGISDDVYNQLKELPLFREGRYASGFIEERQNIRKYPYDKLARRVIGFVRDNKSTVRNTHVGIEGKFDHILHGEEGYSYQRRTDLGNKVLDYSMDQKKAENGKDIRTTLDIDLQDIAHNALKERIEPDMEIEGGCAIVMDVKTGAIRTMVNLLRDPQTGLMEESMNLAIGRLGEPGSVFKAVNLMTHLEDKKVKTLQETMPTNHGRIPLFEQDRYIVDFERENDTDIISIADGLAISSNYVFRRLAIENYKDNPQSYIDKIYMYKLGESFDFDLEGMATPQVPDPSSRNWSGSTLGSVAIGYSVSETPLHILTFYNAIANNGKMMKPYIVESIEEDGIVVEKKGPSILNASICSKATADTLTNGLVQVVQEGTGSRLKTDKYKFAAKTGTARVALDSGHYTQSDGSKKHQGTFVGFFPADDPQYSIIVVVYSVLTKHNFYGGGYPAQTVREIADYIYATDPYWREKL